MAKKKAPEICVVTVAGIDKVGIIAKLSNLMAKANINILDVSQKIMEKYFVMTMAVDISKATISVNEIHKRLNKVSKELSLAITFQHENIFKMMHRV